jgi:hypothetical protein
MSILRLQRTAHAKIQVVEVLAPNAALRLRGEAAMLQRLLAHPCYGRSIAQASETLPAKYATLWQASWAIASATERAAPVSVPTTISRVL